MLPLMCGRYPAPSFNEPGEGSIELGDDRGLGQVVYDDAGKSAIIIMNKNLETEVW